MTEFEKLISRYTDAEQYLRTAGFFHVATRASEIETRKLIDAIVEREGYGADLQKHKGDDFTHTAFASDDRKQIAYAIPRRFFHQKDGSIEVKKIEVVWYTYKYADDETEPLHTGEETETVIPITGEEESRLLELTHLERNARNDFEAVKRMAINNLFKEKGIEDDGDKSLSQKLNAVRDLADGLIEAVTKGDAENLQEIQHKQITQHWQILSLTDNDTRKRLTRFFCPQHYYTDEKSRAKQLACVYSNYVNNIVTAIPEGYIHDRFSLYHEKKDHSDADLNNFTLVKNCLEDNRKRILELSHTWFYEVGGEYVKEETAVEDDNKKLQHFADSEAVIQDYTSPQQQIYALTKASRGIFNDIGLAEDITMLDNGQLQFTFAVSKADAKTQRAVIVEIADTVKELTKFDRSVMQAVFSVIEAGNTTFTSKQVAIQNTQNEKPSPNTVGAYTKSIEKMQAIVHRIDATEHHEQNGDNLKEKGIKKVEYTGYLLPVEGMTITMNNGTKVNGYRLIKNPILLEYSKGVKQIHTVDNEVLNVPVRLDETTLLIRDYLIQQIGIIYNARSKVNNNILISTVLDYAGVDLLKLDRTQKKRLTDKIKLMLQYWNGEHIDGEQPIKSRYIEHGYKLNYRGKSLESITINPRPKTK